MISGVCAQHVTIRRYYSGGMPRHHKIEKMEIRDGEIGRTADSADK